MNPSFKVGIRSPEGEVINLVSTSDAKIAEGAKTGAQALLNLFFDEMDLEEGYAIVSSDIDLHRQDTCSSHDKYVIS